MHRNHALRKRVTLPPRPNLGSIEEEPGASEYGCVLDLGAETPSASSPNLVDNNAFVAQWAQAGIAVPHVPARRPSWKASSGKERSLKKESVDRDCGICFEYAVIPCRTLCCGKIFCTEHLADVRFQSQRYIPI
ncbi:hypothetical protein BDN70DRAFT_815964 [Pholiota conissans]|uniref:Uncharacterized protein n=1 Tax=Pholiota conissans TaxID=109636 RepID=A0A9P5YR25_9AGAR|nr:hypothetical protein BDN70DRAFT_815964 [Pholiota conissans]